MWAAAFNPNPDVIAALLKAGAEVNAKDDAEETPLMWAARNCSHPAVIAALVNAGADVNTKSRDGATPLAVAAAFNANPAIAVALIKAGANVDTALNYARQKNDSRAVEALVKAKGKSTTREVR